jgi:hypothetical protein
LGTIGSGRYGSAWDSTFAEISKVLSSGPNTVLMTSVGHPRGLAETAFGPLGEPIYVKLPDGDYESALYVSQNGKMAVISNGQNPPMWSLFMEPDQVDSMYHASKK